MNKTNRLLILILPLVFLAGCIEGQAVITLNKNGSGKAVFEGLFNYAAYSKTANLPPSQTESFFLNQLAQMLASSNFECWKDVEYKLLKNGKCYFKGTAYFQDINQTDFYIGSNESDLKLLLDAAEMPILKLRAAPRRQLQQPALLQTVNVNLVIILSGKIEETENFEQLDSQTAATTIRGYKLSAISGSVVFTPDEKDLFDYRKEVQQARKESEKIIRDIEDRLEKINIELPPEELLSDTFNYKMRQGIAAESQKKFNEALNIYNDIINDPNADERFKAAANYQIGICFLQMGEREKAEEQFEYVINTFPLQRGAALKSTKMLQDMRSAKTEDENTRQNEPPFVVNTFPPLYAQDVDPNLTEIVLTFSQPMRKTNWFYSSFKTAISPQSAGQPYFDPCGVEWTLPVKLMPGRLYAIAVNYGGSEISNFKSVSGKQCEKFILLFATLDNEDKPTFIDDEMIEECEKINNP